MVWLFIDEVRGNYLRNRVIILWYSVFVIFFDILCNYSSIVVLLFIYCINEVGFVELGLFNVIFVYYVVDDNIVYCYSVLIGEVL